MAYEVEFTGEFEAWWNGLTGEEQESMAFTVRLLEERGSTSKDRMLTRSMGRST